MNDIFLLFFRLDSKADEARLDSKADEACAAKGNLDPKNVIMTIKGEVNSNIIVNMLAI